MRSRLLPTLAASAILLAAATAQAGTLTSATWITEGVGFGFPTSPFTVPITATGTSTATAVSVSLTVPQFTTGFFLTGALPLHAALTLGGAQALTATPSMAAATMGVAGSNALNTAYHTPGSMLGVGATLAKVPLTVGVKGAVTGSFILLSSPHSFSVGFYGWTPHTHTIYVYKQPPDTPSTVMVKGSFNLSAMGGGTVTLVAPSRISINGPFVQQPTSVSLTTLKLTFVPEPGTLLLLGAGGVALAMRWRRYGNTR
ncbi:MAG: PEP-CTERM sorting domain-containing protein [Myxococcota bacterium]